ACCRTGRVHHVVGVVQEFEMKSYCDRQFALLQSQVHMSTFSLRFSRRQEEAFAAATDAASVARLRWTYIFLPPSPLSRSVCMTRLSSTTNPRRLHLCWIMPLRCRASSWAVSRPFQLAASLVYLTTLRRASSLASYRSFSSSRNFFTSDTVRSLSSCCCLFPSLVSPACASYTAQPLGRSSWAFT
ncbi:hypothetical protein H310_14996, partial [Aphanomyces invadans]